MIHITVATFDLQCKTLKRKSFKKDFSSFDQIYVSDYPILKHTLSDKTFTEDDFSLGSLKKVGEPENKSKWEYKKVSTSDSIPCTEIYAKKLSSMRDKKRLSQNPLAEKTKVTSKWTYETNCDRDSNLFNKLELQKTLKKQIIYAYSSLLEKENMPKTSAMPDEREQLHLHHHEHHHYYYLNNVGNESFTESAHVKNNDEENLCRKMFFKKKKKPKTSNFQLEKVSSITFVKSESCHKPAYSQMTISKEYDEIDCKSNEPSEYFLDNYKTNSSSTNSLNASNKSDLLMTHSFSESNVSTYDCESVTDTQSSFPASFLVFKLKGSDHKNIRDSDLEADLLKNLTQLKDILGPKWEIETKKMPKVSYIKHENSKTENFDRMPGNIPNKFPSSK